MLVLDTEDLPAADRVDAYHAAAVSRAGSCSIEHELDERGLFRMRMQAWQFGEVTLFSSFGSGMRYRQTEKDLRREDWDTVAIFNQAVGDGGIVWNDTQRQLTSDELGFACKGARYWESHWTGIGENNAFLLPADRIGLPGSVIAQAMPLAGQSPLVPILLTQLRFMRADADSLNAEPAPDAIGDAVVALVRGVIASVTSSVPLRRAVAEETRLTRVLAYLFTHLTDTDLTPARIAAAHNLTVPALHRLFHDEDLDVDQWITEHRLRGAHDDLTSPPALPPHDPRNRPILGLHRPHPLHPRLPPDLRHRPRPPPPPGHKAKRMTRERRARKWHREDFEGVPGAPEVAAWHVPPQRPLRITQVGYHCRCHAAVAMTVKDVADSRWMFFFDGFLGRLCTGTHPDDDDAAFVRVGSPLETEVFDLMKQTLQLPDRAAAATPTVGSLDMRTLAEAYQRALVHSEQGGP